MKQGLLLLLILAPLLQACRSRESTAPAAAPTPGEAVAQEAQTEAQPTEERPETLRLRPVGDESDETGEETAPPAPRVISATSTFLARDPDPPIYPRDFEIGSLQPVAGDGPGSRASSAARSLLAELSRGRVNGELIAPEVRDDLSRTLAYHVEEGNTFQRYRIGKAQGAGGGEMRLNVRLVGKIGVIEGEIYVALVEEEWLVTDLQFGLPGLRVAYEVPQEPFVPSVYELD